MKNILLFLLLLSGIYQSYSQSKETMLYMREEFVKQRDDLIHKAKQIQQRIDSIDKKLSGNTDTQYLTKSVNYTSEYSTYHHNTLEKQNTQNRSYSPTTSTRTYYRGPRGGCYYINRNGNKTYVARSMCN